MENISAQTNFRISAKPKIRVLNRFKAQDLKIGSFVKLGLWTTNLTTLHLPVRLIAHLSIPTSRIIHFTQSKIHLLLPNHHIISSY